MATADEAPAGWSAVCSSASRSGRSAGGVSTAEESAPGCTAPFGLGLTARFQNSQKGPRSSRAATKNRHTKPDLLWEMRRVRDRPGWGGQKDDVRALDSAGAPSPGSPGPSTVPRRFGGFTGPT
jgi:hypothetical protein